MIKKNFISESLYILGSEKRKLPLMFLIFLLSASLDLFGLGLIAPYIALAINPDYLYETWIWKYLEIYDLNIKFADVIISLGILLVIVAILKAFMGILVTGSIIKFSQYQQVRVRKLLMEAYQTNSYKEYIKRNSSEYVYAIQVLANEFAKIIKITLQTSVDLFVGFLILIFLFYQDPSSVLIVSFILTSLFILYDKAFKIRLLEGGKSVNEASAKMIQSLNEAVDGYKEIRILNVREFFKRRLETQTLVLAKEVGFNEIMSHVPKFILEALAICMLSSMVLFAFINDVNIEKVLPIIGLYGFAALRLFPVTKNLGTTINQYRYMRNGVSIIKNDLLNVLDNKINDSNITNKRKLIANFKKLEVKNIKFSYGSTKKNVLNNLSLTIKLGETVGVVGKSGEGKTTLIDILLGLLDPSSGRVQINNLNIKNCRIEWQNKIGIIPQDIFLTDDTLLNNILLGTNYDKTKMKQALSFAQLDTFVSDLPEGLNTNIGERGGKFSGGQKQRVILARMFYHDRQVLIMDEATSALDTETEQEILANVKSITGKVTLIIISHRKSFLKSCDKVYELNSGKLTLLNKGKT